MPDWRRLVEERFTGADIGGNQRDEVIAELASHLEEVYGTLRARGDSKRQAVDRALAEVANWDALVRRIGHAKRAGKMNHRTKSVWIPGLLTVTLGTLTLAGVQRAGLQPHIIWLPSGVAFMLYVPWLVCLPFIGGLGAYASRRAGGGTMDRISSGLFPTFAIICSLCVAAVFAVFIDHATSHFMALGMTMFLLNWIILSAGALLIGVVPFLSWPKLQRAS